MTKSDAHIHKYDKTIDQKVTLRKYVKEDGKPTADIITGIDKVKCRKCKCGKLVAYDLERKIV